MNHATIRRPPPKKRPPGWSAAPPFSRSWCCSTSSSSSISCRPLPGPQRHPAAGDRRPVGDHFRAAAARQLAAPGRQHGPELVLGFLVTLAGMSRFVWATAIIWVVGGLGTWLIGNIGSGCGPTDHIGASGLIFGWLAFLLVFGLFTRRSGEIVIGIVVLVRLRRCAVGRDAGARPMRRGVLAGPSVRGHRRCAGRLLVVGPGTQGPAQRKKAGTRRRA